MQNSGEKRELVINRFLDWCEKINYSGKEGIKVVIIDGLPISVERPTQSLRFDVDYLTATKQNATME
jgi:hypothetical protein